MIRKIEVKLTENIYGLGSITLANVIKKVFCMRQFNIGGVTGSLLFVRNFLRDVVEMQFGGKLFVANVGSFKL